MTLNNDMLFHIIGTDLGSFIKYGRKHKSPVGFFFVAIVSGVKLSNAK